ncbi:MAG: hypothetical protein S4CHLAM45_09240 [Chlamydiales bacterium]|nr:hypothetical protein [Chlamydiales bacterium]MCH9620525.1 hypothetical protein [Chlamydiales bacterium]MCH9623028.1 hypothetical protein [Chlamydiales bacterium]
MGWFLILLATTWMEIQGREEGASFRRVVYRAKVEESWQTLPSPPSLKDTKIANATFLIGDQIKMTLHSFPAIDIPPPTLVERWKTAVTTSAVSTCGQSGFCGLFLEGIKGDEVTLAWAFQLDPELAQRLHFSAQTAEEEAHYLQMAANFTIKATGPSSLIEKHRDEICQFANSIELIQEIP